MIDRNAILETIAIPLMSQCVANTIKWGNKGGICELFISHSCVVRLFRWADSPQGYEYWKRWSDSGRVGGLVDWNN